MWTGTLRPPQALEKFHQAGCWCPEGVLAFVAAAVFLESGTECLEHWGHGPSSRAVSTSEPPDLESLHFALLPPGGIQALGAYFSILGHPGRYLWPWAAEWLKQFMSSWREEAIPLASSMLRRGSAPRLSSRLTSS